MALITAMAGYPQLRGPSIEGYNDLINTDNVAGLVAEKSLALKLMADALGRE